MEQSRYFGSLGAARRWAKRKIREGRYTKPKVHITTIPPAIDEFTHNRLAIAELTLYSVVITDDEQDLGYLR